MPGRPPTPTALKLLKGNPGKRKISDQEPKPTVGAEPPVWLKADPVLLAAWNRHAPRLTRLGLLTEIDDEALAVLCVLEVRLQDVLALAAASQDGPAVLATGTVLDLSKELRMLWSRFGMTPADRARVKVDKAPPQSKLERFLSGTKG